MLWPFLQIFDQDLLKWIQWFENVSKPLRITLESTQVNSNGERSNSEKIPISLTYTKGNFANLHMRPPLLDLWFLKLLYNTNKHNCIEETRIKSKEISNSTHI